MERNERIRQLRESRGMSMQQLADKLGLAKSSVAKWELGMTQPTVGNLLAMSRFFNCSTDYILGLESPPEAAS